MSIFYFFFFRLRRGVGLALGSLNLNISSLSNCRCVLKSDISFIISSVLLEANIDVIKIPNGAPTNRPITNTYISLII